MGIRNGLDTLPSGGGTAKTIQSSLQTYCHSLQIYLKMQIQLIQKLNLYLLIFST